MMRRNLFLYFILFLHLNLFAQEKHFLFKNWQFSKVADTTWHNAIVPGTVHTDLYRNKLIPDPFYGLNEYQLQWIGQEDWQYRSTFDVPSDLFIKKHLELVFEGLDTYAKIYLNDSLILSADNMFREWSVDVKPFLKENNNRLVILFESVVNKGLQDSLNLSYPLPGGIRVFTRKAQYQYGWDWSPKFMTCGIWKPVYLNTWDDLKFENIQFVQDTVMSTKALLHAIISTSSEKEQECRMVIRDIDHNETLAGSAFELGAGINKSILYFQVDTPKLWWTNGLGEPNLYHLELSVFCADKKIFSDTTAIGIRSVELVQKPDSVGASFYFKLNGQDVFIKGANFIPADNFLPSVSKSDYDLLLDNAKQCHMNMLRVWGGGIYEDDYFYKLCDEKGILVWQDFMFACAMYPGDSAFLENVNSEAAYQVKRLRNHPCIALWCGNNEISEAWNNWGWQKQYNYSLDDSARIWNYNKKLFENNLHDIVGYYDPTRSYWPSSPQFGWGRKESLTSGDAHYWGVWWGMEPFSMYEKKIGRFMSEYGFQAHPADATMQTYLDFKIKDTNGNPNPFWHNKHPLGFQTIDTYLLREYYDISEGKKAKEQYTYLSQLAQAYGIKTAIEAHRRAMPYCMGSLYWQFNDCWPGVSWSGIDYFGRWKALQYFVKKAFSEHLISVYAKDKNLEIFVVTDVQKTQIARISMTLEDFYGKKLWQQDTIVSIDPASATCFLKLPVAKLINDTSSFNKVFFSVHLFIHDSLVSQSLHYFVPQKQLQLPKAHIKISYEISGYNISMTLTSGTLAKNVFLKTDNADDSFSDNYFDLLPGEKKTIQFFPASWEHKFKKQKPKVISYQ